MNLLKCNIKKQLIVIAWLAGLLALPSCIKTAYMTLMDTTRYASGYSEYKFQSIRFGMSEHDVVEILGNPIKSVNAIPSISWYYGPPTLRISDDGGLSDESGHFDSSKGFTLILSGMDGRVRGVSGYYLGPNVEKLVGAKLTTVHERFGEPRAIIDQPSSKLLIYSITEESGSYYTRIVGLDASGKVNRIIAGYYFD